MSQSTPFQVNSSEDLFKINQLVMYPFLKLRNSQQMIQMFLLFKSVWIDQNRHSKLPRVKSFILQAQRHLLLAFHGLTKLQPMMPLNSSLCLKSGFVVKMIQICWEPWDSLLSPFKSLLMLPMVSFSQFNFKILDMAKISYSLWIQLIYRSFNLEIKICKYLNT